MGRFVEEDMKHFFIWGIVYCLLGAVNCNGAIVAVIDSGVDVENSEFAFHLWNNHAEQMSGRDGIDSDGNSYIDDFFGYSSVPKDPRIFNPEYRKKITPEIIRFFALFAKAKTGDFSKDDLRWFKSKIENKQFLHDIQFAGTYSHGTHVAGIISKNYDSAQLMAVRYLPVSYESLAKQIAWRIEKDVQLNENTIQSLFQKEIDKNQLKQYLDSAARRNSAKMQAAAEYLHSNRVNVANCSFGVPYKRAEKMISSIIQEAYDVQPASGQLAEYTDYYLEKMLQYQGDAVDNAPETFFVFAAGNESADNDILPGVPSNLNKSNTISVAATFEGKKLAKFSNYGIKTVDVAAPGVN